MSFKDLHTDESADILGVGQGDSVGLSSRLMTLSGTWTPNYIIVPQRVMWMQFKSSPYVNEWVVEKERGFHVQLQWKRNEVACAPEEFQCQSATICLHGKEHCNGYVKCPDDSDEFNCDLCGAENIFVSDTSIVNITSHNYPLHYPLNLQCVWYLLPPQRNTGLIIIRFLDLIMGAYKDHVAVGQGMDASNQTTELTRFSESWSPLYVSIRDTPAWLRFDSDGSYSAKGFHVQMSWSEYDGGCPSLSGFTCHDGIMCLTLDDVCDRLPQCLDQSDETYQECCGTTDIRIDNGDTFHLYSPRYPKDYPLEVMCTWFVTANLGKYIMVKFIDFFTEKTHDTLTLGYGRNASSSTEIITLSLSWTPVSIIVDEANMWLRFASDSTVVKKGFHVSLKEVNNQSKAENCRLLVTDAVIINLM
ncbi:tolloid-like protein 2 [Amphiura filiformis]|uniref:tolloid-like protein 2 n=1 Tax=Amphiura filiformis TaxID=82378 RepID=UPI003B218731